MKKPVEKTIPDDPDQLFFEFAANTPAAPTSKPDVAGRAIAPSCAASLRQDPAFMTESRAAEIFDQVARQWAAERVRSVKMCFKPFRSTLYSFRISRRGMAQVKLHQAFRSASEDVLRQAAQLMLISRRDQRRALPRVEYDQFVRAIPQTDFDLPGARKSHRMALPDSGRVHSLAASFDRVNREYFKSQIQKPELCWSPVRARRILGSYQERADRLIVSQVFDSPKVPEIVIDYLMYHELLHKFLGIGRKDDGRRNMHGRDFRHLEKQFRYFREVQAYLKRM
ncbi:MAG TPA: hypothetical protein VGP72_23545 [Planctomycetota bacterium]